MADSQAKDREFVKKRCEQTSWAVPFLVSSQPDKEAGQESFQTKNNSLCMYENERCRLGVNGLKKRSKTTLKRQANRMWARSVKPIVREKEKSVTWHSATTAIFRSKEPLAMFWRLVFWFAQHSLQSKQKLEFFVVAGADCRTFFNYKDNF